MADDTTDTTPPKVKKAAPAEGTRTSGCPVCGGADVIALNGPLRQCMTCASTINGDGTVNTEGKVDDLDRVLGTTPAQPLPEAALEEQEGAPDLDRVRGTTPPEPLPVDAYDNPRVLGTTPPEPVPPLDPVPNVTYGDSTGATSDSPPDVHGAPVLATDQGEQAELLAPKVAAKVEAAKTPEEAEKAAAKMPVLDGSVGDQPKTDESYSTTSGFPSGETKIVTPGETPPAPEIASE